MLRSRMQKPKPPTWKELLDREQPLLLPCAHDALSARLIERAGFTAYSIGGFALVGSRYGIPDIGAGGVRRDQRRHPRHHGGDKPAGDGRR